jgi:acetolactate synthase I/II/III large subunit
LKVSDYIISFLEKKDVKFIFELSGGMISHLLDSVNKSDKIKCISVHHEQTAAFAADAAGRLTGKPGIAFATSGPGATNLITGIASCYFDSTPALFITGQVNTNELRENKKIRQLGFQETDIVSIVTPITKKAIQIKNPADIPILLEECYRISLDGRPGPVLIDIPMDVQKYDISNVNIPNQNSSINKFTNTNIFKNLIDDLNNSKKPLILVGGGIRTSNSSESFRNFLNKIKIPTVHSLMGIDVLPYEHPLFVGMIGTYGNRWANQAISKADFLLVLGSRLDIRQTGALVEEFKGKKIIYHVDCDLNEINNRITGCHAVEADLNQFLLSVNDFMKTQNLLQSDEWMAEISLMKQKWSDEKELIDIIGINPNQFLHRLSIYSKDASVFVTDVGQHQMWAAQSLELSINQRFLTSGGLGSMGFGLPASIASALITKSPVVLICGDAGFQCNIQELQTVVRNKLPIKIIILNNNCHGMTRQFQESYFSGRYQSSLWGYDCPDFIAISSAYGIKAKNIKNESEIDDALKWFWSNPNEPALLEVKIDTFTNAYPKMLFGEPPSTMEPNK